MRGLGGLMRPGKMLRAAKAVQKQMAQAQQDLFFDPAMLEQMAEQASRWMAQPPLSRGPSQQESYRAAKTLNGRGRFIAGSFVNKAGARDYKLYIPSRADSGQALPLLVMLHGCTQDPDDFAQGTRMNDVAEQHDCFVLYPGQHKKYNGHACWNWFKPAHQRREEGEPSIIADMTRHIAGVYPIDPARLYIAGLSAGGAMTAIITATYPELYAAAGIHSGLAYRAAHDLESVIMAMKNGSKPFKSAKSSTSTERSHGGAVPRFVPTIVLHGDRDQTVNVKNSDRIVATLKAGLIQHDIKVKKNVQAGSDFTRTLYQDGSGQTCIEDWRLHGADHFWSGGDPRGSHTSAKGPNASEIMMRFFLAHSLPQ